MLRVRVRSFLVLLLIASSSYAQQATWTHFSPAGGGPLTTNGLGTSSTAYDAANDRVIIFGGSDLSRCCNETNDTWLLVNASGTGGTPTWQRLTPNAPAGLPQGRIAHSAVYDSATNRMIIFGGGRTNGFAFGPLFNDVWVLTNANGLGGTPEWVPRSPSGAPPAPREGHGAFYRQATNEMIIFGGGNNGIMSVPNDLWSLENANSIDTQPTWVPLAQAGDVPGRLEHFASAYDTTSNLWTIALGCCFYTNASRFLALNGPSGTPQWTNLSPGGTAPPGGDAQNFFYDQDTNSLYVQTNGPGGWSSATWLLSGVNANGVPSMWTNIIPKGAPGSPPDNASIMGSAYNPASKKFIVALSRNDSLGNRIPEVWVLGFGFLSFPLAGKFPDNTVNPFKCDGANTSNECVVAISAVMDHDVKADAVTTAPLFYTFNTRVGTYTGEEGVQDCGHPPCSEPLPYSKHGLAGYKSTGDTAFQVNGNYTGGGRCVNGTCSHFLFYAGHTGYDYPSPLGTEIIAPADGLLFIPNAQSTTFGEPVATFDVLAIDHGNGYASWFLHLGCEPGTRDHHCLLNGGDFRGIDANGNEICSHTQLTTVGCAIRRGDVIGLVGNKGLFPSIAVAHLHFEVRMGLTEVPSQLPICSSPNCSPVDPYGWTGSTPDPYSQFLRGLHNVRLWK
jgi:hypothetical protein